jgi:hypothetical protein
MAADRLLFLFTRMIINEPFSPTLGPLRQDPEPETPHQKAAQVWDDRIGSARVQARNWRLIAFGNLTLAAGVAAALVWQSANGTIVPWVVQVDRFGAAQAVAPAIADYRPSNRSADCLASRSLYRRGSRHHSGSRHHPAELATGL